MGASGVDMAAEDLEVVALEAVDLEEVREGLAADTLMVVALLEAMVMVGVVLAVGGTMEVALDRMEGLAPAVVAEVDEVVVVVLAVGGTMEVALDRMEGLVLAVGGTM